jgi:type II secretory pathway pseudopilin PulG
MNGPMRKYYLAMLIVAAVGLIAVVWQYTLSRGTASDQRKVGDISEMQSKLDTYYQDNAKLPANLSDLDLSEDLSKNLSDYEYTKTSKSYTLCANFKTDASNADYGDDSVYFHGKGRQCFTQDVFSYDKYYEDLNNSEEYDFNSEGSLTQ